MSSKPMLKCPKIEYENPNEELDEDIIMVVKGPANKNQQPDFGRYHHSTQRGSEKIRDKMEVLFTEALGDLPFSRDDEPQILDIGCGFGFSLLDLC